MTRIGRLDTPDCPACGCNMAHKIGDQDDLGSQIVYQCDHCRHKFYDTSDIPLRKDSLARTVYNQTHCPHCNSPDTTITSKPGSKTRYHVCGVCKRRFRSDEVPSNAEIQKLAKKSLQADEIA